MRVAVIDIGSNSTRLLVADVGGGGSVDEVTRQSQVTRLGRGVDVDGRLSATGVEATRAVIERYLEAIAGLEAERVVATATSAVRDAANGAEFLDLVAKELGVETRLLDGESEARLSYVGARAGRDGGEGSTLVVDIGGGSTELIVGEGDRVVFHDSLQLGVVRHSERHIASDPPTRAELDAIAADAEALIAAGLAAAPALPRPETLIAVAGTATSLAAIDLGIEPYDPERVHRHRLDRGRIETILDELAAIPESERRRVPGMHPDRAPTIVAGVVILLSVLKAFGIDQIEVSEHDLLWGAALQAADS